ncbi:MAG TPA: TIM44-like domain-containing protein [Tepidisphaeraceae bacterium]
MRRRWGQVAVVMLLVLLTISVAAYGRAGGGGHFSGGGHSSGGRSSGGGHSFGGGRSYGNGRSYGHGGTNDPASFVIILIVVLIIVAIAIHNARQQQQVSTIRRGAVLMDRGRKEEAERELSARDPAFDPARFYGRVRDAFLKIQRAWCGHDLTSVRAFLSDGVIERFTLQIAEQRALGVRDEMSDIHVRNLGLDQVTAGDVFEAVTLRIDAWAVDYEVSLVTGAFISGSREPQPFSEYWTFVRRRGAASITGNGLIEGNCPNCASAIEMNENANCAHCGALLKSGQHDWVLVEITQESEYRRRDARDVQGLAEMREVDPELTLEELEDRASVLFWRRIEAQRVGDVRPLRKVALDQYCERFKDEIQPNAAQGARHWLGECGVGSVETLALTRGDEHDRALVEVRWSGSRFLQRPGEAPRQQGQTPVMRSVFVLARKSGVKSSADRGITSAHCPSCGAPATSAASSACDFCATVLNDGSVNWVLEDVMQPGSARLRELGYGDGKTTPPSASGLIAWMVHVASCDRQIDPRERQMILKAGERRKVDRATVIAMLDAAGNGGFEPPQPANREEARQWLQEMAGMALADGKISPEESYLLRETAKRVGYVEADIKMMLARKRQEVLEQARARLRNGGM